MMMEERLKEVAQAVNLPLPQVKSYFFKTRTYVLSHTDVHLEAEANNIAFNETLSYFKGDGDSCYKTYA